MPLIYTLTGSAFFMALVPFITTLSRFLSAFLAPTLFRILHVKDIMVYSQLLKTITMILLVFFTLFWLTESNTPLLYVFVSLLGFLDGWASPSSSALIPKIVERDALLRSNSWMESVSQTVEIAVWPLGALLVATTSSTSALILTVILYCLSSFLIWKIVVPAPIYEEQELPSLMSEAKRGWRLLIRRKDLLALTVSGIFISSANIVWLASIMYVYVEQQLQVSEAWWGYMNALLVSGLLVASIVAFLAGARIERFFKALLFITASVMMLAILGLSLTTMPLMAVGLAFLYGCANQIKGLLEVTYIQKQSDEEDLPYIYAAQEAAYLLTFAMSVLGFSFFVDLVHVQVVMITASGFATVGLAVLVMFSRHINKLSNSE
ncbi:MFS transporter [Paenalkalicoccus suaedae]|uniref:MFS transporter n=2 Tax=Paenalkalicoccus suaedae TaxID=2592382 RepID=A0A859FBW3_9BACI|nr:MFS transporter [Paenalkalicoccus suaedae]QKS69775.1 MFS transporter [Paenalkalicoccus suaedae]